MVSTHFCGQSVRWVSVRDSSHLASNPGTSCVKHQSIHAACCGWKDFPARPKHNNLPTRTSSPKAKASRRKSSAEKHTVPSMPRFDLALCQKSVTVRGEESADFRVKPVDSSEKKQHVGRLLLKHTMANLPTAFLQDRMMMLPIHATNQSDETHSFALGECP